MKKFIIAIVIIIGFLVFSAIGKYNTLVIKDEGVITSWGKVETQYQRRLDLVPALVSTVKGYAKHEKETLTAVISARASATKMEVNLKDAEELAEFQSKQSGLSSALGRLMMITENYPQLQASPHFSELTAELAGTENRISVSRDRYNDSAKEFNIYVRQFPTNLFAKSFGFGKVELFKAEEAADKMPEVKF